MIFNWFHKNKFNYEKGQLAPIFIVVLVVLLIMVFVTMNLSKVAIFKTESSNAADAGGLAAGSVMANVFNGIAQSSSQMETYYWEFWATADAAFILATTYLKYAHLEAITAQALAVAAEASAADAAANAISAESLACPNPCGAIAPAQTAGLKADTASVIMLDAMSNIGKAIEDMAIFTKTVKGILVSVTAFYAAQLYFYDLIRDYAEEGRDTAVELGHKFAFMNVGIGAKLKEGSPDESIVEPEKMNNYSNIYSEFLDNLCKDESVDCNDEFTYNWLDGQDRGHLVSTKVKIDLVDIFNLRVTVLPFVVEVPLLGMIIDSAITASASLAVTATEYGIAEAYYKAAAASYWSAVDILAQACACYNCRPDEECYACQLAACAAAEAALATGIAANADGLKANTAGLKANAEAIATITSIYAPLAASWAGLYPGEVICSSDFESAAPFIICWIEDVMHNCDEAHNRLVTINTTQHHQGQDFAVWKTEYPDINSYSIVNFTGDGVIHPPVLRHDASIIETDKLE